MTAPASVPLLRLLRHELRRLNAERVWLVLAAFFVLCGYAVGNGAALAHTRAQDVQIARAAYERRLAALQTAARERPDASGDPYGVPNSALFVGRQHQDYLLPPAPLAALAIGQSELLPARASANLWSSGRDLFLNRELDNPANLSLGRFDLAFVVVYLLPLLALALSFDLLSRERELGTLPLLLSGPTPLARIVLAKALARTSLCLVPAASALLGGATLAGAWASLDTALAVAAWLLALAAYAALWVSLSVLVNTLGVSSASNATLLACAWLALVLVLPATLSLAAELAHPAPSRLLHTQALRAATNTAERTSGQLLTTYLHDHPEMRSGATARDVPDWVASYVAVQDSVDAANAPVQRGFDEALARQNALVARYAWLSPPLLLQRALEGLSGTGPERHAEFMRQARAFHATMRGWYLPKVMQGETIDPARFDALPRFEFDEPDTRAGVRAACVALLALLAYAAVFAGLARLRTSRPLLRP